jgi:hypothetical protein
VSVAVSVVVFVLGLVLTAAVLGSAMKTVILPRGVSVRLGRTVFVSLRLLFKLRIRSSTSYEKRDRLLAPYAPLALMCMLGCWLVGVVAGFTAMFWAIGAQPVRHAFTLSGSSIVTLGFAVPGDLPTTVLAFTEAALGLLLVALLITFLPTIYSAFQARESMVARLEARAGSPPTGAAILMRLHALGNLDYVTQIWIEFQPWFVAVEQTHTMFPALPFFRSPQPDQSWVTAAGAVLDGASLAAACLDRPRDLEAELSIRAGYLALRRIAALFRLPYDPDPRPDDPIAVTREEFDEVYDRMAMAGVPLRNDRDQAWRSFAGWRVNYDTPLIRLAGLTEAPLAPWSSDRGLVGERALTFIERIRQ